MKYNGYSKKQLLDIFYQMALSRRLDEKQLILLKQGKGFFHIGGSGHSFNAKTDYFYPYYRDQAFCIGLGMTSKQHLLAFMAKESDPSSGGRQMPQHYGCRELNIVSQSSPTGTQFLQALGAGFALQRNNEDGVVYVSAGEGTTSQGDFHEALNWASRDKVPVIFHIQNNKYAISVPIENQTAGASVYKITAGYDNLSRFAVDGTNYFETRLAFSRAIDRARKGKGPSIIESEVVRLLPHSSSDDQRKYRSEDELEQDRQKDPLDQFSDLCINQGIVKQDDFDKIRKEVVLEIDLDAEWAEIQPDPIPEDANKNIFSSSSHIISNELNEEDQEKMRNLLLGNNKRTIIEI